MKIALNALYYREPLTGISRYTCQLMKWLVKLDTVNEYVYFISEKYVGDFPGLPVIGIPVSENFSLNKLLKEPGILATELKKTGADIFHSPHFILPGHVDCRRIITFHDTAVFEFPNCFPRIKKWFWNRTVPRSVNSAHHIIADSEAIMKKIGHYFPLYNNPVSVIPLGVDTDVFQENPEHSIDIPDRYILFVGIISPRKNLVRLIRAFHQLVQKYEIHHHLVLVGGYSRWEKPYFNKLLKLVEKYQLSHRVHFAGYVPDDRLVSYYQRADVYIHPALGEGFGLPVLEAMSAGIPVAVADDSSLPELVDNAGVRFDPWSETAITDTMNRLINDNATRDTLINKGLERVKQFTWEHTARLTIDVYSKVMQQSPSSPD